MSIVEIDQIEDEMMNTMMDHFVETFDNMPIGLYQQGVGRFTAKSRETFTGFCGLMQSFPEGATACSDDHNKRALAGDDDILDLCHMGLFNYSHPIIFNNERVGALLAGQRKINGRESESLEIFNRKLSELNWNDRIKTELRNSFSQIELIESDIFETNIPVWFDRILSYFVQLKMLRSSFFDTSIQLLHDFGIPLTSLLSAAEDIFSSSTYGVGRIKSREDISNISRRMVGQCDLLNMFLDNYDYWVSGDTANQDPLTDKIYIDQLIEESHNAVNEYAEDKKVILAKPRYHNWNENPQKIVFTGSRSQMQRFLINVYHNAIKYSYSDSRIKRYVRTDLTKTNDNMFEIRIGSLGVPINENELEDIFNAGYRSQLARAEGAAGSGLGLYVVKQIIDNHSGAVRMDSSFEGGPNLNILTAFLSLKL